MYAGKVKVRQKNRANRANLLFERPESVNLRLNVNDYWNGQCNWFKIWQLLHG
ncbi:hypothetical protein HYD85_02885 [Mycoplasmopsis bovis]|nr:hypothetical protein [Mycoplasmopsis bovis]QQH37138.1 hypothetical protein HYD85_02885 [Mycoplasmopsis bovis]